MKKLKFIYLFVALLSALFTTSCSENEATVTPVPFPEKETKSGAIGETLTYTFTAGASWRLNSPLLWCSFLEENERVSTIYGEAGQQSVKLLISEANAEFDQEDELEITMTMNGQTATVLTVKRLPEQMKLALFDMDGNEIDPTTPMVVAYGDSLELVGQGNFTWALTNQPAWLTFAGTISGTPNNRSNLTSFITTGYAKYAQQGSITLGAASNPAMFTYQVVYDGIPADEIEFTVNESEKGQYQFSADGSEYYFMYQSDILRTYPAPLAFEAIARNDEYTIVYVEELASGCRVISNEAERWFHVADDKAGNLSLSLDANSSTQMRQGYLVVLPAAVNEIYAPWYHDLFVREGGKYVLKEEVLKYVALPIKQQVAAIEEGYVVTCENQRLELLSYRAAGGDPIVDYGMENVWILSLDNRAYATITVQPTDALPWQSIMSNTWWQGVDTAWDGVELSEGRDTEYKPWILINGVTPKVPGRMQMVISVMDNMGETTGYLLVEQW